LPRILHRASGILSDATASRELDLDCPRCSLVAIESGYLIGYRAGLKLNITSFVCNNLIALVLLGIGTILYREAFTLRTGSGMVICATGLLLLLR
jgi:hypothetical protein